MKANKLSCNKISRCRDEIFVIGATLAIPFVLTFILIFLRKSLPELGGDHVKLGILLVVSVSAWAFLIKFTFSQNDCVDFRVNMYIKFFLLITIISELYKIFNDAYIVIGLPFGHAGDFFQLIDLSIKNKYAEVTSIGYLPGVLSLAKMLSFLFPEKNGDLVVNGFAWLMYFLIQFFVMYIVYVNSIFHKPYHRIIFFMTLCLSYPFLLNLERGNWVFLSMLFLGLALNKNLTNNPYYFGVFASLKALNAILLLPLLLLKPYQLPKKIVAIVLFSIVIPFLMVFITDADVSYSSLLTNITGYSSFPDAHIAVAHSGAYSLLVFLQNVDIFTAVNREVFIKTCMIALKILLIIQIGFLIMQFFILKKLEEVDAYLHMIYFFIIVKLLHHNNTDMNLVLLIPILLRMNCLGLNILEKLVLGSVMLLTINFNSFFIYNIVHNDQGRIFSYAFTFRTLLYPLLMFFIMLIVWVYMKRTVVNFIANKRMAVV